MKKADPKKVKLLTWFSLVNLMVMVAIFLLSSIVLYQLTKVILIREMDDDLSGIENKVKVYVSEFNKLPEAYPLDEEKINFVLSGPQAPARSFELTQLYSYREMKMHNFRKLTFPLRFNNNWYQVTVAKPLEGIRHLSSALIKISLGTILLFILITVFLNKLLLRRLWKPFYASMTIMRNFRLGKTTSLSFPDTSIAEFAFMNESLLVATQKAELDYLLLREFTENASHEMQTPLSVIRSKLDMMMQEKDLSERQSELARGAYASIKKLSRLNQSLLLLAKIENQQFSNIQKINLKDKLEEKIVQFQELWQNLDITVDYEGIESYISMSPELLDILLNNLLSNAINHNIPSGKILIDLEPHQLIIRNTGLPVSLDEKRLFMRFYKESVNSNHNGLGLSIVKQISKISGISTIYQFAGKIHSFSLKW
ncbi:MAG TPA: HAMP domain-containing sensor histidine kinase [Daejeonella sp.]|nr:HAMP domain-containing sensor histidine kinase [Daejeonella sp.]